MRFSPKLGIDDVDEHAVGKVLDPVKMMLL